MVKKLASLILAVCASVSLAACEGQSSDAVQRFNAECSKASDAIQYNKKENSILYIYELELSSSPEPLPGLSCITKTIDVTADELNDQVQDDGSGYLEKNGYSIGISSTGQNVTLTIEDHEKRLREVTVMKFGMRTPSPRRSLKARTTGKWKRQAKKALIPGYGRKGMGWIRNPREAVYNKVYRKTTLSFWDLFK